MGCTLIRHEKIIFYHPLGVFCLLIPAILIDFCRPLRNYPDDDVHRSIHLYDLIRVITYQAEKIRIISVRRSRKEEIDIYES